MAKKTKRDRITRILPCKLGEDEVRMKGEQISKLVTELASTKDAAKGQAAQFKAKGKELTEKIMRLSGEVNAHSEDREVVCELVPDYRRNVMEIERIDSGEVIDQRALTSEERQLELSPDKPKRAKKGQAVEAGGVEANAEDLGLEDEPPMAPRSERKNRKSPRLRAEDDKGNEVTTS